MIELSRASQSLRAVVSTGGLRRARGNIGSTVQRGKN